MPELGEIKAGYLADLIMVYVDPLADLTSFTDKDNILMIMKDSGF